MRLLKGQAVWDPPPSVTLLPDFAADVGAEALSWVVAVSEQLPAEWSLIQTKT